MGKAEALGKNVITLYSLPIVSVTKPFRLGQNWLCALTCTLTIGQGTQEVVPACREKDMSAAGTAGRPSEDGENIEGVWIPDLRASDVESAPPRESGELGGEERLMRSKFDGWASSN